MVLSEIHYNPGDFDDLNDLEFVEIYNPKAAAVDLTDWRIRGGVDFDFADGTSLPAGDALVILSFDPAQPDNAAKLSAFRAACGIDETVPLVGGYSGSLSNGGEAVRFERPGEPPADEPQYIPRLLEDEVVYDDTAPWPVEADGQGDALRRIGPALWAGYAANWAADVPTPGQMPTVLTGDVNVDGAVGQPDLDPCWPTSA